MPNLLANVVVDSADPHSLARFWSELLEWPVAVAEPAEVCVRSPVAPYELDLVFVPVTEAKTGQNRIHLDLASTSPAEQLALVERAVELGGRPADVGQDGVPWIVLADPEGNEFCVLEPRDTYRDTGRLAAIVVASPDPRAATGFWTAALGRPIAEGAEPGLPHLEFLPGDPKTQKDRLHVDLVPEDQEQSVAALLERGARRVDPGRQDVPWVVLSDPDGGEFCVLAARDLRGR
ncbi:VOC family protein [Pseudonocardia pini]|uniref:VOC family protein n=1 Tax=Pseudonocardia pini TaxID=2758030 RepID=UPI0015F0072A|nr:VOC family protein [Pseudonocardia pini]